MPVFDLYVMMIQYLKNHAMRMINRHADTYSENDVIFNLLIPTAADDRSKWLIRQAATKVWFDGKLLCICSYIDHVNSNKKWMV